MTTTTTIDSTTWAGWWRPNGRTAWTRLVSEAPTYDLALERLLAATENVHGGDNLIVRGDQDPNQRRPFAGGGRRRL